jgi:hypothetical protein
MGAGRAHSPTLPISPIFSEFNPAQKIHAAHLSHFAQIAQFLNCQVHFNVADLRAAKIEWSICACQYLRQMETFIGLPFPGSEAVISAF